MGITVLFFGQLADITGARTLQLDTPDSLAQLKKQLLSKYPGLESVPFNVAVNTEIVDGDMSIATGSTIALLPPFSGG